ncbi:MAG TPA: hypothetical protein VL486_13490 [Verrucomicrobiae bacterium]|nr:hypothetical protein [Verrucomicrobiae bacterium]
MSSVSQGLRDKTVESLPSPASARSSATRPWRIAAVCFLSLYALLIVATFRDYGMSWDQPSYHEYGETVVRFYRTWGHDQTAQTHWLHPYGGLFLILAAVVTRTFSLGWLEGTNLTSALFGLLGVYAGLRLGWRAFGPRVGVTAAVFLALTPVYYGHQFINPKDLPFAALVLVSVRYIADLAMEYPRWKLATILKATLAIGGAMAIRVGGLILIGVLGLATVAAAALAVWRTRFSLQHLVSLGKCALIGTGMLGLTWGLMILFWPYAWAKPIHGPFLALKEFSKFGWNGYVFYNGQLLKAPQLPWSYVPNLVVNTMPEFVLLGWCGLLVVAAARARHWRQFVAWRGTPAIVTLIVASLLPLATIYALHSNLYDGLRHVLFILPPVIVLAAGGIWWMLELLRQPVLRRTWGGIVIGSVVLTVVDMRTLHPYQYVYFNRVVAGGLARANDLYDLDYWATALREAALWARDNYHPNNVTEVLYSASGEPAQTDYFLQSTSANGIRFRRATAGERARLYFVIRRQRQGTNVTWGHTLHVVERHGVPLLDIVETD